MENRHKNVKINFYKKYMAGWQELPPNHTVLYKCHSCCSKVTRVFSLWCSLVCSLLFNIMLMRQNVNNDVSKDFPIPGHCHREGTALINIENENYCKQTN